jgi:hypothetical protein
VVAMSLVQRAASMALLKMRLTLPSLVQHTASVSLLKMGLTLPSLIQHTASVLLLKMGLTLTWAGQRGGSSTGHWAHCRPVRPATQCGARTHIAHGGWLNSRASRSGRHPPPPFPHPSPPGGPRPPARVLRPDCHSCECRLVNPEVLGLMRGARGRGWRRPAAGPLRSPRTRPRRPPARRRRRAAPRRGPPLSPAHPQLRIHSLFQRQCAN